MQDRRRRQLAAASPDQRVAAPRDHQHDHHRRHLHDPQRIVARLVDALRVPPPEVARDEDSDERRRLADRQAARHPVAVHHVVQKPDDVEAGRDAADGPGQHVVEEQRRDGQLRERAAHRLFDDAIDAAPNEHRRAFDIDGADGVGKAHDAEDEPRRGFAHGLLGNTADVERARPEVVEHDRRGPPEGDECEEYGRGDDNANASAARAKGGIHSCFRITPTGLAVGLGLRKCPSALSRRYAPEKLSGPRRPASGAELRPTLGYSSFLFLSFLAAVRSPFRFCARRRTCTRMGVPTKPNSSRS